MQPESIKSEEEERGGCHYIGYSMAISLSEPNVKVNDYIFAENIFIFLERVLINCW